LVDSVVIPEPMYAMIAEVCNELDIKGLRGDISVMNIAVALAALEGRTEVIRDDVEGALVMGLTHRRAPEKKAYRTGMKKQDYNIIQSGESAMKRAIHDDRIIPPDPTKLGSLTEASEEAAGFPEGELSEEEVKRLHPEVTDVIAKIGDTFNTIDLFEATAEKSRGSAEDRGKRQLMRSSSRSGRYAGSKLPTGKNPDLAFDATVRAAAPYQVVRHQAEEDLSVIIEKQDLREKIREIRSSSTFLFAVDTSGSLIIRNRMMMVKAAILSLLKDHYAKKDRVGFMTFNEDALQMLLPPTRSVECIYKLLDNLPVGKRTPLSSALVYLDNYMSTYMRKHQTEECYVILVTDGNANVCLDPNDKKTDAVEEALSLAARINNLALHWIVVDSEKAFTPTHNAKKLAEKLRARYFTLEELKYDDRQYRP
jgi:magnesium chelatase subunit D